jgi:hypothetical protein
MYLTLEVTIWSFKHCHLHIGTARIGTLRDQGCQMVYFQTKNPNLGNLCSVLEWKILVYFMPI